MAKRRSLFPGINIGITGQSGAGKSSFVNAVRGLHDDDDKAAKVDIVETTGMPTVYEDLINPKIKFWDLPGIGTPNHPDLETYDKKVQLERYDMFLIFTNSRLTKNDLELAKKIKVIGKKFFLVRAKIDENIRAEKRKRMFNEDIMLNKIRRYCSEQVLHLLTKEDIFLISNHHHAKWDFMRLIHAISSSISDLVWFHDVKIPITSQ